MISKILLIQVLLVIFFSAESRAQGGSTKEIHQKAEQKLSLCKKYSKKDISDSLLVQAKAGLKLSTQIHQDSLSAAFTGYLGEAFGDESKADSAIKYYNASLNYASHLHNDELAIVAQMGIAYVYEYNGTSDSVYSYVLAIEKVLKRIKNDDIKQAATSSLAGIYSDHNQYEKAITYYLANIRYNKKANNERGIGIALVNIGNTYLQMSKSEKALPYFKEAISHLSGYPKGLIVVNDNIGATFTNLNKPDSAVVYHSRAIKLAKAIKDSSDIYAAYEKLSAALIALKKYKQAEQYLNEALAYSLKTKEMTEVIDGYTFLGQLENERKSYGKAAIDFKNALHYAINSKHTERETEVYRMLAENQANAHIYNEAYGYELKYNTSSDSLNKESAKNSITELVSQYQSENKQQQINLLTQEEKAASLEVQAQKRTQYFLVIGLVFVIVIVGLMIRGYNLKQKANLLFAEKNIALENKNDELKELNEKLDEANQSKAKLFGILSHDLRAPIGSVFQFINLQKNHPKKLNEEESKKHNERILQSAENLMDTMEDILIWSKSQMDSFSLKTDDVNICQLLNHIIALHQDFADAKQITLENDCAEDLEIHTDLNFLKIVLRNIVSNGIKFTPAGGHILLSAEGEGDMVRFKIHDNGVGMTKEQIAGLFEWNSIRSDSSGLGLKLAREFTTRLGGTIEVESTLNKGTTFIISIPQDNA